MMAITLGFHFADIVNPTEYLAEQHVRVASFTIILVSLRVIKEARTLWMVTLFIIIIKILNFKKT